MTSYEWTLVAHEHDAFTSLARTAVNYAVCAVSR
jgi:hypothetical protein